MDTRQLIKDLMNAPRLGAEKDDPEGARYVQISETALVRIINALNIADKAIEKARKIIQLVDDKRTPPILIIAMLFKLIEFMIPEERNE